MQLNDPILSNQCSILLLPNEERYLNTNKEARYRTSFYDIFFLFISFLYQNFIMALNLLRSDSKSIHINKKKIGDGGLLFIVVTMRL